MDVPARCDVVVAGGGPTGSTAATLLVQKGYDVVLLEKARHPRYKVGESLIPHFWKYCELMGAAEIPYLSRLLEPSTYVQGSFHAVRDYSYRPARLTGPGFFLIGDAAAFVDPIFSIGIVLGMYSGYLAAWAIDRSLRDAARTKVSQAISARQWGSRLEAGRALALPRYGYGAAEAEAEAVSSFVGFETALEQELMYVVSTLSTRSENFVEMARDRPDAPTSSDRYRVLPEIVF